MTACRSSFFFEETRSSSPWTCARTPLGPSSLMILETFFAFSWVMPSLRTIEMRYSLPDAFGSAGSRCLRETPRLTSFSLKTSRTALARSSLLARISTPCSPDQAIDAPTPRKSNRLLISFAAWFSALSASWRSILLTMSKLDSLGMIIRLDGYGASRHTGRSGFRCARRRGPATMPEGPRRNQSCCPLFFSLLPHRVALGRLPEWPKGAVCKTVGSAYVGSNPTPATTRGNAPGQRKRGQGMLRLMRLCAADSDHVRVAVPN